MLAEYYQLAYVYEVAVADSKLQVNSVSLEQQFIIAALLFLGS